MAFSTLLSSPPPWRNGGQEKGLHGPGRVEGACQHEGACRNGSAEESLGEPTQTLTGVFGMCQWSPGPVESMRDSGNCPCPSDIRSAPILDLLTSPLWAEAPTPKDGPTSWPPSRRCPWFRVSLTSAPWLAPLHPMPWAWETPVPTQYRNQTLFSAQPLI